MCVIKNELIIMLLKWYITYYYQFKITKMSNQIYKHVAYVYASLAILIASFICGIYFNQVYITNDQVSIYVLGEYTILVPTNSTLPYSIIMSFIMIVCFIIQNIRNGSYVTQCIFASLSSFFIGMFSGPFINYYFDKHFDNFISSVCICAIVLISSFIVMIGKDNNHDLVNFENILYNCLTSFTITSIIFIFIIPTTIFSIFMSFVGIILFTCYIMYDTNDMIKRIKQGETNYWIHSMHLFLDLINLFTDLLRFLHLRNNNSSRISKKKNV